MPPRTTIGEQLHNVRIRRRMTLEQLAGRAAVAVGTISELERGNADPRISTVIKLANAMGGRFNLSF